MQAGDPRQSRFQVRRIRIRADRLECTVCVPCPELRRTTPKIAQEALAMRPSLAHHACINERGRTFRAVLDDTATPHLFEHFVVDCQVRRAHDAHRTFVGTTRWICEREGLALVELSFADDLQALDAVREAAGLMNELLGRCCS
ncbi:hypothetical protein HLV37_04280 [Eggerthellaceae bacterium zg-1084]|uniref:hypothetical protein n=1 Tax=Berryella wangjianweii TaxID=2734634 RepID=UPI001556D03B|nr:hypothetical protein [Berryella wangjianweii]NPD31079.1 hypothetical protein [Berryella wangjianweii]NPD31941.1 hypothetical protein [Eggerthellaceae bacterium zg-997]